MRHEIKSFLNMFFEVKTHHPYLEIKTVTIKIKNFTFIVISILLIIPISFYLANYLDSICYYCGTGGGSIQSNSRIEKPNVVDCKEAGGRYYFYGYARDVGVGTYCYMGD